MSLIPTLREPRTTIREADSPTARRVETSYSRRARGRLIGSNSLIWLKVVLLACALLRSCTRNPATHLRFTLGPKENFMNFKDCLARVGVAAAAFLVVSAASAAPLTPVFTFAPGAGEGGSLGASFKANNIGGEYNEALSLTSATDFDVSIQFSSASFSLKDTLGNTNYNAGETGLGFNYGLYALFTGSGTYSGSPATFILNPGGSLKFYLDPSNNTKFTQAASGSVEYGRLNFVDDLLLSTGVGINGIGFNAGGPNLFGAFGQTTSFNLTADGLTHFIDPIPFYDVSFQSGQFEGFPVVAGTTTYLTGTLNAVFVPEPSAIALTGIALLALGFVGRSRRRA